MPRRCRGIRGDVGIAPYIRLPSVRPVFSLSFRGRTPRVLASRREAPVGIRNPVPATHQISRSAKNRDEIFRLPLTAGDIVFNISKDYHRQAHSRPPVISDAIFCAITPATTQHRRNAL